VASCDVEAEGAESGECLAASASGVAAAAAAAAAASAEEEEGEEREDCFRPCLASLKSQPPRINESTNACVSKG
jgi:hypothetical protein